MATHPTHPIQHPRHILRDGVVLSLAAAASTLAAYSQRRGEHSPHAKMPLAARSFSRLAVLTPAHTLVNTRTLLLCHTRRGAHRLDSAISPDSHADADEEKELPKGALHAVGEFLNEHFLLLGIAGAISLAAFVPTVGCKGGPLRPELTVNWGVMCLIFFIAGLRLRAHELAVTAMRLRAHLVIQSFNFGLFPLIVVGLSRVLRGAGALSPALCDGLLTLSAVPTSVNTHVVLTRAAHGNEALAIFNGVVGNLLGLVVSPLLLLLLVGRRGSVPLQKALKGMLLKLVVLMAVGQALRVFVPVQRFASRRKKALGRVSEVCLLLTVFTATRHRHAQDSWPRLAADSYRLLGA
eukprot:6586701-Prymnesium_polylepis.4